MIPVYIAAPYSDREDVWLLKQYLEPKGYEVLDRWTRRSFTFKGNEDHKKECQRIALEDIGDIMRSQIVIVLLRPHEGSKYGWLVEFGMAITSLLCDEIWIVGPSLNVFDTLDGLHETEDRAILPRFLHFENIDTLIYAKG